MTSEYITAVQATFKARDLLEAAGFISVGRSDKSEACYLARKGRTWARIRVAAHGVCRTASAEGTMAYITFADRSTDHEPVMEEIDGEMVELGQREVKHTGLDDDDIAEMVEEAIAEYDAAPEEEDE